MAILPSLYAQHRPHDTNCLQQLRSAVSDCKQCERSAGSMRVIGSGPIPSTLMIVGETPGPRGANLTGCPFVGDQTARNLERLLSTCGIRLHESFVTNAVLCMPRDHTGKAATPSAKEIENCSEFLMAQVRLARPHVIVSMGAVALRALGRLSPHNLIVGRDHGRAVGWEGHRLLCLYHPSPRVVARVGWAVLADDISSLPRLLLDA